MAALARRPNQTGRFDKLVTMPGLLVATPLKYSAVSKPYQFGGGLSIREISPIRWDRSNVNHIVSEQDRHLLAKTKYWLCAARESAGDDGTVEDKLYDAARHAAMALQIICPIGAKHIFLNFQQTSDGWDINGSFHPNELYNTLLGRITPLEDQGLAQHFDLVYAGIRRAHDENIVRLINPIQLLEHGMQIGNVNLGALMFVMALDMLVEADKILPFMQRVGGFLGLDSLIFPADSLSRQPKVTVGEVLNNLYVFRNIIAHGQEIPEHPYREQYELVTTDGIRINYDDFYFDELMLESGLFLLTTALRKIFTENLFDEFTDPRKWKIKQSVFENRYKQANGSQPKKLRGR